MKKIITLLIFGLMIFVFSGVGSAGTYVFSPLDNDGDDDLYDLDHYKAYSWEIDMTAQGYDAGSETINSMTLFFDNIKNHDNYRNDLFVSILDSPGTGTNGILDWDGTYRLVNRDVDVYSDSNNDFVNYFTSRASSDNSVGDAKELILIQNLDTYANDISVTFDILNSSVSVTGVNDTTEQNQNTTSYSISSSALQNLVAWAQDGIFELGFDSDCHFYNDGIQLTINTGSPPPPSGDPVPEPETLLLLGIGLIGVSAFGRKRLGSGGKIS